VDADDALLERGHDTTGRSLLQAKKGEPALPPLASLFSIRAGRAFDLWASAANG
jgi:hypothetical protein